MNRSDSIYAGITFTMFVLSVIGFAVFYPGSPADTAATADMAPYHVDVAGDRYTVADNAFRSLCPGTDCIPALDAEQVSYESVGAADQWLEAGDAVVIVTPDAAAGDVNGPVAIPLQILKHHYVVNTVIGDTPVAVTYSPYSGHVNVFRRNVQGDQVTFAFSGKLLYGENILVDRETGTYWDTFSGTGIRGPLTAVQLEPVTGHVVRWGVWRNRFPHATVLSRNTSVYDEEVYSDDPYARYHASPAVPVATDAYDRSGPFQPKTLVYGTTVDGVEKAYKATQLTDQRMIQDRIGGEPVLLVQDADTGYTYGFVRTVNGETYTFSSSEGGMQSSDGTVWHRNGTAVSGPLQGATLHRIRLDRLYWFSWQLFHPDTDVYRSR